jgi:3D (Asp-Asp-Asp) domain-containing protein
MKPVAVAAVAAGTFASGFLLSSYNESQLSKIVDIQQQTIKNQTSLIESLMSENEDLRTRLNVVREVTMTGYTPTKKECDADPLIAASMKPVRLGTIAVSRDLFEKGWTFGRRVYIINHGIFQINDLMAKHHQNRIDMFFWKTSDAKRIGTQSVKVALLGE